MRLGSQQPRIRSVPEAATSAGDEAIEYSRQMGLVMDPWQELSLRDSLRERGRRWAAFEVGLVVARQNGKGGVLEARELSAVQLFGSRLVVHTAHELKTASDAFRRMVELCEGSSQLSRQVEKVSHRPGEQAIQFRNGGRIQYMARSRGSGRGWTEADLIVFDEAMFLAQEMMDALVPTMTTAPNPQLWFTGSAGLVESDHLLGLRQRAVAGGDETLCYLEWSAEENADLDDLDAWYQANPALGIRITEEFVARERAALSENGFARERLGIWDAGARQSMIDPDVWARLGDTGSRPGEPLSFGVNVSLDERSAVIAVAGRRDDGRTHVELVSCCRPHAKTGGRCSGTAWVAKRCAELDKEWKPAGGFTLYPGGPAGKLILPMTNVGVEPVLISGRELAAACGSFYGAAIEDGLRHIDQAELTSAVDGARRRPMSDAWIWHIKDSAVDISPLYAATLAAHGVGKKPKKRRKTGRAMAVG